MPVPLITTSTSCRNSTGLMALKGLTGNWSGHIDQEHVKKTHDREYYQEEVIAIEDKLISEAK